MISLTLICSALHFSQPKKCNHSIPLKWNHSIPFHAVSEPNTPLHCCELLSIHGHTLPLTSSTICISLSQSHSISLLRSVPILMQAETAAPLLKWMQNEANEAAVRTMVPAPSSENLYKHEAMGQLGGDLLMNLVYFLNPHTWFYYYLFNYCWLCLMLTKSSETLRLLTIIIH